MSIVFSGSYSLHLENTGLGREKMLYRGRIILNTTSQLLHSRLPEIFRQLKLTQNQKKSILILHMPDLTIPEAEYSNKGSWRESNVSISPKRFLRNSQSWAWGYSPIIPDFWRLELEDYKLFVSLNYTERACLKKKLKGSFVKVTSSTVTV